MRPRILTGLAFLACAGVSACDRADEATLRATAGQWFALGETMGFDTRADCAAAAFRLVDVQIGSGMPVVNSVPRAVRLLAQRGAVAVDNPDQPPDATMFEFAETERFLGFKLRGIALEARLCMDEWTTSAFGLALVNPRAIVAYDQSTQMMMLMDPDTMILVAAMGAP